MTYKRMYGMSQSQFNDEMFRGYQHLVNFDFTHARKETRKYACTFNTELETTDGWYRPKNTPEEYGFNAILLDELVNLKARNYRLQLKGDNLRYGFVGVTTDGESLYSPVNATTFEVPAGKTLAHLYLIVMGAPMEHQQQRMPMGEEQGPKASNTQFPYTFRLLN